MAKKPRKLGQVDKNIYQRGPFSFQVKMMVHGHKIDKTFDNFGEAQTYRDLERGAAALDHTEGAIYTARAKKRESKSYTFGDAIKDYRPISEKKKGSLQEGANLDLLSRLPIAEKPLYTIHSEDLVSMFNDIKSGKYRKLRESIKKPKSIKPCSEATARRYSNLVRHIFQIAKDEWKKVDANPFDELAASERQKDGKPRDRRFKGDEYAKLKKALDKEARAALVLFVESGMRRGELLRLDWQFIKFNGSLGSARLPIGSCIAYPYFVLDDVKIETALEISRRHRCFLVSTSVEGGCQVWIICSRPIDIKTRYTIQSHFSAKGLCDMGATAGTQYFRFPHFKNHKRGGQWVNLIHTPKKGDAYFNVDNFFARVNAKMKSNQLDSKPALPVVGDKPERAVPPVKEHTSPSEADWHEVVSRLCAGETVEAIISDLQPRSMNRGKHHSYARRTVEKAERLLSDT